ncbi:hypothetical protein BJ912DRAFT_114086 [Pholiota molesta]|nr:hypothetical protein BJ912DRAFT_114086 [Pholiota molesta]
MALAQPPSQPPSPTVSTGPRSSSRSERLLRDTLIRDEIERNPTLAAPLTDTYENAGMSPPSPKGHRRRHSHVPASTFSSSLASSSPERDEYTRGTFLFRTAMNNPRSPSPTPAMPAHPSLGYYGGDAEGSPTMRRHRHHHSQSVSYQQSPTSKPRPTRLWRTVHGAHRIHPRPFEGVPRLCLLKARHRCPFQVQRA